jgi:hypothetical protein
VRALQGVRVREGEREWAARNGRGGASVASACVVGVVPTACPWVVRVDGWGTTLTGGVHGPAGESARTDGQH